MTFLENLCKKKISTVLLCGTNNEMRKRKTSYFRIFFFFWVLYSKKGKRKDFSVYPKGTT